MSICASSFRSGMPPTSSGLFSTGRARLDHFRSATRGRECVMDLDFSPADQEFRDEVRTWLRENVPGEPRPHDRQEMRAFDLSWQRRQHDGGWAGIAWPVEYGGRGMTLTQQLI